jgi:putative oxidoreductase
MDFLRRLAPYAHWLLRIALASVFLYHGLTKFPNLQGLSEMMQMPVFMIALVAIMETAAGVLILLGGFGKDWITRLGGLLIGPVMLGAIVMVHLPNGWSFMNNGMEFQFTLLMLGLYFTLVGNGTLAAEHAPTTAGRTLHEETA